MRTTLRESLLLLVLTLGSTVVGGLALYELSAKSAALPGGPLPGWQEAERADLLTPWHPRTGFLPLDRVLHEGQEACLYYDGLLGGLLPRSDATLLDIL